MTDVYELRRLARDLADAYAELEELKWTPPRTPNVRVMKPQFRSTSPSPDNDWALNLEHELTRDTTDERVPGGLRAMACDALGYTTANRAYLDETRPGMLCAYIARHAGDIAEKFPAADDLAELLSAQHAYLVRQTTKRHGPPPQPRPEARHNSTVICALLAQQGVSVTPELLRKWAERGKITSLRSQGRNTYLLSEVIRVGGGNQRVDSFQLE